MTTRKITVVARSSGPGGPAGENKTADLQICDNCRSEVFGIYIIDGHPHLQCAECGETYCQGNGSGCGVISEPPKCRVCGCTDEDACATLTGPCSWVEQDLCSACVDRPERDPRSGLPVRGPLPSGNAVPGVAGMLEIISRDDIAILGAMAPLPLELRPVEAFLVLSNLQLATRHPNIPRSALAAAREVGRHLQDYLSISPGIAQLCELGWNPAMDVPSKSTMNLPPEHP